MQNNEPPPTTRILSDVGEMYKEMRAGRLTLESYVASLGNDLCVIPGCLRPATVIDRTLRYCPVCAMRKRSARAMGLW